MSRYAAFSICILLTAMFVVLGTGFDAIFLWPLVLVGPLTLIGLWDLAQSRHSLLRNYPLLAHLRWMFEGVRPEIRQYLIESDQDAVPFSREQRNVVYQRAKDVLDKRPFGTRLDVSAPGYEWLAHSTLPREDVDLDPRVAIGGPDCAQPYDASVFNISAMSFGSLSANAIRALNEGARIGGFAHDTGEGGISRYHREPGGDLIWEIGSGYFGCRNRDGSFDPGAFADNAAPDQVRMVEIKVSQGAKPGHGGVLPAAKISAEIAAARGVPLGEDCVSPAAHSAFSTPLEMMSFIQRLRELSNGKPVGFKLCIGHRWEFMAMVKAMLETGIMPDFIVIDGKEGGTGAAPLEFTNRMGTPLTDGLVFARNVLIGAGLRDRIRLGASGKLVTAFYIARAMALGADWCNSARGFMFALGCIQAQACHTNRCPVGVATQDGLRQRALVVGDKAQRVANFHRNTVEALSELVAAVGVQHPSALSPRHLFIRRENGVVLRAEQAYPSLLPAELIDGAGDPTYAEAWDMASAARFTAA